MSGGLPVVGTGVACTGEFCVGCSGVVGCTGCIGTVFGCDGVKTCGVCGEVVETVVVGAGSSGRSKVVVTGIDCATSDDGRAHVGTVAEPRSID